MCKKVSQRSAEEKRILKNISQRKYYRKKRASTEQTEKEKEIEREKNRGKENHQK